MWIFIVSFLFIGISPRWLSSIFPFRFVLLISTKLWLHLPSVHLPGGHLVRSDIEAMCPRWIGIGLSSANERHLNDEITEYGINFNKNKAILLSIIQCHLLFKRINKRAFQSPYSKDNEFFIEDNSTKREASGKNVRNERKLNESIRKFRFSSPANRQMAAWFSQLLKDVYPQFFFI